ncbi:MAG: DUF2752 domain-containing protein [Kiritimatiellae bacterium]|nr:DUF2752 domain-containing protein [Kiritimatiellia bacterium]
MSITVTLGFVLGVAVLIFLYFWSPQNFRWFPKCPFLALTGYKCPGCGTLRAIHSLLHFQFSEAVSLNPFMIVSIPLVIALLASRRLRFNAVMGMIIVAATATWWLLRNVFL